LRLQIMMSSHHVTNGHAAANGASTNGASLNGASTNGSSMANGWMTNGNGVASDAPHTGFGNEEFGIVNMEVYFPSSYVDQRELEQFDGASEGKYTIGLGQTKMGFCSDAEDVNSLCLTAVSRLVEKSHIGYADIGRLEVGTETLLDKSKSVKTVLMRLFEGSGNTDVEGVHCTNACYGGTAALFNCLAWCADTADYDGRYALAVCADIAVYASGPARPTGGAGAVAMLIGRKPALVLEKGLRATHVEDVYDFYKPDMMSEYPTVDGALSIKCYLRALDKCYQGYRAKAAKMGHKRAVDLSSFDAVLFHTPFCKLVQKSLARLRLNDFAAAPKGERLHRFPDVDGKFIDVKLEESYFDKDVEKAFMADSREIFLQKTKPSLNIATNVGNLYTPSLYGGLVSYLCSRPIGELAGSRVAMFSYGSGLVASFFSLKLSADSSPGSPLAELAASLSDVQARLDGRSKVPPADFDALMLARERFHHAAPYQPTADLSTLAPGTWYLTKVDEKHRRDYARKDHAGAVANGH